MPRKNGIPVCSAKSGLTVAYARQQVEDFRSDFARGTELAGVSYQKGAVCFLPQQKLFFMQPAQEDFIGTDFESIFSTAPLAVARTAYRAGCRGAVEFRQKQSKRPS